MEWQQQYIENQHPMNAITADQKMSLRCAMSRMIQMQPGTFFFPFPPYFYQNTQVNLSSFNGFGCH